MRCQAFRGNCKISRVIPFEMGTDCKQRAVKKETCRIKWDIKHSTCDHNWNNNYVLNSRSHNNPNDFFHALRFSTSIFQFTPRISSTQNCRHTLFAAIAFRSISNIILPFQVFIFHRPPSSWSPHQHTADSHKLIVRFPPSSKHKSKS